MLKLVSLQKEFKNENGKITPYNDVVCPVTINGLNYDIRPNFDNNKIVKDNVVSNIQVCYLSLIDKSYVNGAGVNVERFVPMIHIIFNEVNRVDVPVKLTAGDIFILRLVTSLKNKK